MVKIYLLPAGIGDFIWVRFGEGDTTDHNILIDGGPAKFSRLYSHVLKLIAADNQKTLIILTHIDADHIQGAAQGIANMSNEVVEQIVDKIYLNTGRGIKKAQSINEEQLGGDATCLPEDQVVVYDNNPNHSVRDAETFLQMIDRKGMNSKLIDYTTLGTEADYEGAKLRFISPGKRELLALLNNWEEYKRRETIHYTARRILDYEDITVLKNRNLGYDSSVTNRSSLAFLFEFEDIHGAFLGDAVASVMYDGLKEFGLSKPIVLDFVKLPHHGGKYNMSDRLISQLRSQNYLISTEGVPEANVPSKVLVAHLVKNYEKNNSLISMPAIRLLSNYNWWSDTYKNMFFTDEDIRSFIDTGIVEIVRLSDKPIIIKNNLELYNMF